MGESGQPSNVEDGWGGNNGASGNGEMDCLPTPEQLNALVSPLEVAEQRPEYDSGEPTLTGYKRLHVWQVSMDLVAECYRLASLLPQDERYGLYQQLRRAAVSVPLNIAEGWARNSRAEFARFCDISRGSLHEVDAALEVAIRLEYMLRPDIGVANELFKRVGAMLLKLTIALRA